MTDLPIIEGLTYEQAGDIHDKRTAKINQMIADKGLTGYDKWLAERQCGLGGSDVAVILGLSKYKSPYELWLEKTGRAEPFKGNDATHWGQRLEDVIAEEYAERTGMMLHTCPTLNDNTCFWLFGSPDRIVTTKENPNSPVSILEIKTTRRNTATNEIDDNGDTVMLWGPGNKYINGKLAVQDSQVPMEYILQVHVYMLLTGVRTCDLAVLMQTSDYRVYTIDFDLEVAVELHRNTYEWWVKHVLLDQEPPKTIKDLKNAEHSSDYAQVDADIKNAVISYREIKDQIKALEKQADTLQEKIVTAIGENEGIQDANGAVLATYKLQKGRISINKDLLEIEHPELYARYRVQGANFRVLRTKAIN
ncbi:putative phage-type endonuclease [Anaerobiospirillum thomasii]|uniref:Putative phage-type endonuclease n=1 Tax=Anaerobiospirillum thomasii TaxID=179995 RepID=A0A2X0VDL9_9GAMM|nr:YqaJ viral recombinase family protein [Anaerobiospirillum thomasii]SPT67608.1 putative phage-type endonuclease [Anaerobiospirillum thomasii]SPT70071.1 putative phage-type endonuclease [Anaerobiospirillum thomasii]SPT71280.1 putative phage-type endonuclease [Anaerobiospirillum thomasii]SPT72490.1 putative phage-type endonuclease [Anaerobiospirillum thomasii]